MSLIFLLKEIVKPLAINMDVATKKYKLSLKGKATGLRATKKYRLTQKGKESVKRSNFKRQYGVNREEWLKWQREYYKKKGYAFRMKYSKTLKGKLTQHRTRMNRKKVEGSHTLKEWLSVLKKSHGVCLICRKRVGFKKLTKDHIFPISKGGRDDIENIQPLCKSCNSRKNNKIIN